MMIRALLLSAALAAGGSFLDCGKAIPPPVANSSQLGGPGPWICTVSRPPPGADECDPSIPPAASETEYVKNATDATDAARQAVAQRQKNTPAPQGAPPWGCFPGNCRPAPLNGIGSPPPGGCGAGAGGGGGAPAVSCGGAGDACTSTGECCAGLLCALNSCD